MRFLNLEENELMGTHVPSPSLESMIYVLPDISHRHF